MNSPFHTDQHYIITTFEIFEIELNQQTSLATAAAELNPDQKGKLKPR